MTALVSFDDDDNDDDDDDDDDARLKWFQLENSATQETPSNEFHWNYSLTKKKNEPIGTSSSRDQYCKTNFARIQLI